MRLLPILKKRSTITCESERERERENRFAYTW